MSEAADHPVTLPSPTSAEPPPSHWWRRRAALSRLLRLAVVVVPVLASVVVSAVASRVAPVPTGTWHVVLWWIGVTAVSLLVLFAVERVMQRLLPLAALLSLSLVFPDRAPRRFAVARKVGRYKDLRAQLDRLQARGGDAGDIVAAQTVLTLVAALAVHDKPTRGHSERVRVLTDMISDHLHLNHLDRAQLRWASLLHDIGKIEVPVSLLNKPDRPDPDEWETLQRHPAEGARLAAPIIPWLGRWAQAILHHHERWDGTGYPQGLRGSQISLGGRIVAVADAYETMTAARPYKRPLNPTAARQELVRHAGAQFDPEVVRAFLAISLGRLWRTVGLSAWAAQVPLIGPLVAGLTRGAVQLATSSVAVGSATALVATGTLGPTHIPHSAPLPRAVASRSFASATGSPTPSASAGHDAAVSSPLAVPVAAPPHPAHTPAPTRRPGATASPAPSPTPAPLTVDAGGDGQTVEGGTFTSAGAVDPPSRVSQVTVDYGDGSKPVTVAVQSDGTFPLSHSYTDEGQDTLVVTADDGTTRAQDTATVVVDDVQPQVTLQATTSGAGNRKLSGSGSFVDASPDTWKATVNYGDGTATQSLALHGHSFTLAHGYPRSTKQYTVTVTVTDDDGVSGVGTTTVSVG